MAYNNRYQQNRQDQNYTPQQVLEMLDEIRGEFEATVKSEGNSLLFNSEKVFFAQKLIQSYSLCNICGKNPVALRNAFLQAAATGLTMDPTQKLAWIIPQKGIPVYDISYKGLIRVAVDSNIIADAVVDLVFEHDRFQSNGLRKSPSHEYDPFGAKGALIMTTTDLGQVGERGLFRGAYIDYRLPDGSTLVHFVPKDDIAAVREISNSWKNEDKRHESPWANWPWAMVRKSIVRSGHNILPIRSNKLDRLVHLLDQNESNEAALGDTPAAIAGQPVTDGRTGLMISEEAHLNESQTTQQPNVSSSGTPSSDSTSQGIKPAAQSNNEANPVSQSNDSSELTPALKKRLQAIAARASKSKEFSAAFQHVSETYNGEALNFAKGLINTARRDYAESLINQLSQPGVYGRSLDFAATLPKGNFRTNFESKVDETVRLHIDTLLKAAEAGDEAPAVDFMEALPGGDMKTSLNQSLYALA